MASAAGGEIVLIVDDTPTNLQVLLNYLQSVGFKVLIATDGQQALQRAQVGQPDLILLDVLMPGMDGFETCRRLKKIPALQDVPVIFMTALAEVHDKVTGFAAGGVDYITKPLDHEEVSARVRTHLTLRQLQRALAEQNQRLQDTTAQLQAVTEALSQFLQTGQLTAAGSVLLQEALRRTRSEHGLLASHIRARRLRVLALAGTVAGAERRAFSALQQDIARRGHSDQSVSALGDAIAQVVSAAQPILRNVEADAQGFLTTSGCHFLGAPISQGGELLGVLALANRPGGYDEAELEGLARLLQAAGILLECDRIQRRAAKSEQRRQHAEAHVDYLREELQDQRNFGGIVSHSEVFQDILRQVQQVAQTDSTVLIHGETGTGKEMIARALHNSSARCDKPLIKVNCAALPADLVESELFGHEKGAFTGATAQRKGRFELADGGTLFLDEIGDMPPLAQTKLLRVLQEHEFERVGGSQTLRVDVRVLAATHQDLSERVAEGRFREDLFYRLNVFPIELPPLRQRREDIIPLARHFTAHFAAKMRRPVKTLSESMQQKLQAYDWPGNVRELENVIERAVILATDAVLELPPTLLPKQLLKPEPTSAPPEQPSLSGTGTQNNTSALQQLPTLDEMQRLYILQVLAQTDWLLYGEGGAASVLGMNPSTLRNRMAKLGIAKPRDAED